MAAAAKVGTNRWRRQPSRAEATPSRCRRHEHLRKVRACFLPSSRAKRSIHLPPAAASRGRGRLRQLHQPTLGQQMLFSQLSATVGPSPAAACAGRAPQSSAPWAVPGRRCRGPPAPARQRPRGGRAEQPWCRDSGKAGESRWETPQPSSTRVQGKGGKPLVFGVHVGSAAWAQVWQRPTSPCRQSTHRNLQRDTGSPASSAAAAGQPLPHTSSG